MHNAMVNAAATYGHMVVVVAAFMLVVVCTKLGAASTERASRNKRDGQPRGWVL